MTEELDKKPESEEVKPEEESAGSVEAVNLESILAQKDKLDALLKEEFTKILTVMFTDLKGSTTIAETEGDIATRMLLKKHNDIVFAAIKEHNGTLVKTIGDGTLSHFDNPDDGIKAAMQLQRGADAYNAEKVASNVDHGALIIIRAGLHTGKVILEENDIFGDVVNTASRIESSAGGSEIHISEDTMNDMANKNDFYITFVKAVKLKGKKKATELYKVFWSESEIEADKNKDPDAQKFEDKPSSYKYIIAAVVIPIILVLILSKLTSTKLVNDLAKEKRSIIHSIDKKVK